MPSAGSSSGRPHPGGQSAGVKPPSKSLPSPTRLRPAMDAACCTWRTASARVAGRPSARNLPKRLSPTMPSRAAISATCASVRCRCTGAASGRAFECVATMRAFVAAHRPSNDSSQRWLASCRMPTASIASTARRPSAVSGPCAVLPLPPAYREPSAHVRPTTRTPRACHHETSSGVRIGSAPSIRITMPGGEPAGAAAQASRSARVRMMRARPSRSSVS